MRVAVITFFQSQDNYGQLLQCYALQNTLRKLGHKPYLIRYGFHQEFFHWLKKKNIITKRGRSNTLHQIIQFVNPQKEVLDRGFDAFRKKYLTKSLRCYNSLAELQQHPPKASCYITGSDQVWAQLLSNDNNRCFFLDFGSDDVRRISYAPSFAMDYYPQELKAKLSDQLKRFNAISVREQSGVAICEDVGYEAKLVLDPTLLLTVSDYEHVLDRPNKSLFCFIYHVNVISKEELHWDAFCEYNKTYGYQSVASFANPLKGENMEILDGADYVYPTIGEWLGYIKHSEYVLTSSFHGLVFSVLFHRPFVVCLRKESMFAGNDRVMTLLRMLHLEERVAKEGVKPDEILARPIDWNMVDLELDGYRKTSLNYLRNNLC